MNKKTIITVLLALLVLPITMQAQERVITPQSITEMPKITKAELTCIKYIEK